MARRPVLIALVSVLALGVGACAKSPTTTTTHTTAFQLVSAAAGKTQAEKTAHMSMVMHVATTGSSAQSVDVNATGQLDLTNGAASMSMNMDVASHALQINMVVQDGALYMQLPKQLAQRLPSGKSWMKIDLAALAKASGMNLPGFTGGGIGAFDPAQQLDYLRGVSNSVKDVGPDTIDGTSTEKYHVVLDLQKALQKVGGDTKCGLGAIVKSLANTTVPADVWLDDSGRLRQMKMSFSVPGATSATMSMTMKLFDFGTPVSISAPPSSQVYDVTPQISAHLPSCGSTT